MAAEINRTPWPHEFPDVVVPMALKARNQHPAYPAGKSGDVAAAYAFVTGVVTEKASAASRPRPLLAPVAALEAEGFNAIPDAMAQLFAENLRLPMADYD